MRLSFVQRLLGLSAPTVRAWTRAGLFEDFGGSPQRVGLASVARVREHVRALREAGKDQDLMAAVMSALEFEELQRNERFQKAVEQMRRRERA